MLMLLSVAMRDGVAGPSASSRSTVTLYFELIMYPISSHSSFMSGRGSLVRLASVSRRRGVRSCCLVPVLAASVVEAPGAVSRSGTSMLGSLLFDQCDRPVLGPAGVDVVRQGDRGDQPQDEQTDGELEVRPAADERRQDHPHDPG